MKEAQAIIYEWLRSIGYTATQREVKKLADTFKHHGYCKPPDRPELEMRIDQILGDYKDSVLFLVEARDKLLVIIPDKPDKPKK